MSPGLACARHQVRQRHVRALAERPIADGVQAGADEDEPADDDTGGEGQARGVAPARTAPRAGQPRRRQRQRQRPHRQEQPHQEHLVAADAHQVDQEDRDRARRQERHAVAPAPGLDEGQDDADAGQAGDRQLAEQVQPRGQDQPPALDQRRVGHQAPEVVPAPQMDRPHEHDGDHGGPGRAPPHHHGGDEEQDDVTLGPGHRRHRRQQHRRPRAPLLQEVDGGDHRQRRLHRLHPRLRPHQQ